MTKSPCRDIVIVFSENYGNLNRGNTTTVSWILFAHLKVFLHYYYSYIQIPLKQNFCWQTVNCLDILYNHYYAMILPATLWWTLILTMGFCSIQQNWVHPPITHWMGPEKSLYQMTDLWSMSKCVHVAFVSGNPCVYAPASHSTTTVTFQTVAGLTSIDIHPTEFTTITHHPSKSTKGSYWTSRWIEIVSQFILTLMAVTSSISTWMLWQVIYGGVLGIVGCALHSTYLQRQPAQPYLSWKLVWSWMPA